jgi:hypothetical protein
MISLRLSWTAEQVQGQCVLNPEALPQKTKQTKKITLDIYFGENDTFIILNLLIQEHGMSLQLFRSLFYSFQ